MSYFTPDLFKFLKDLKAHNNRTWFESNKARYEEDVKEPMLRFITDLGPRLKKISPQLRADPRPAGGSMFRIYRDVRFSRDKSPYKTNVGAHFSHVRGTDAHAPGLYLHLAPGQSFGGGGLWHPDADALKAVRDRIVARPAEWKGIKKPGAEIEGDALKRVPAGYDPEHVFAEDLKHKDFYIMEEWAERQVVARDFMDRFLDAARGAAPLMRFASKALGLPW